MTTNPFDQTAARSSKGSAYLTDPIDVRRIHPITIGSSVIVKRDTITEYIPRLIICNAKGTIDVVTADNEAISGILVSEGVNVIGGMKKITAASGPTVIQGISID